MKVFQALAKRFGYVRAPGQGAPRRRGYESARTSRLTSDWLAPGTSADAELRGAVCTLRAKSREAERNDDYIRRYLTLIENNVLGASGIGLQMKITDPDGTFDEKANTAIETAWQNWGKKRNCTVTRQASWRGTGRLVLRSAKRDGGLLLRFVRGYKNAFRYAVQLMEIDQLAEDYNAVMPGGGEVRMGVEFDEWRAPVAYHLYAEHPGDSGLLPRMASGRRRVRVPVGDMLHIFLPDRIAQTVGAPAPSATLMRLKMLAGYEEAELVAAREAACKGYGIKRPTPEQFAGETDSEGRALQNIEPGMGLDLAPGEEYFGIDPQHPMDAYPSFVKQILRAIAGGLGVSYNSLANDLEGVNYSSLRAGLLDEREEWKAVQQWLIEELCEPVFEDWLEWCLGFGLITLANGSALPAGRFDKFNAPDWKPRRWPWVDPQKDIEASIRAIGARLKSRRSVIAEDGGDMEDVDRDFAHDPVTEEIDTPIAYVPQAAKARDSQAQQMVGAVDASA